MEDLLLRAAARSSYAKNYAVKVLRSDGAMSALAAQGKGQLVSGRGARSSQFIYTFPNRDPAQFMQPQMAATLVDDSKGEVPTDAPSAPAAAEGSLAQLGDTSGHSGQNKPAVQAAQLLSENLGLAEVSKHAREVAAASKKNQAHVLWDFWGEHQERTTGG